MLIPTILLAIVFFRIDPIAPRANPYVLFVIKFLSIFVSPVATLVPIAVFPLKIGPPIPT